MLGQGSTFLTLADSAVSQVYLGADHATVQDLTVTMTAGPNSSGDKGLTLNNGAVADHVMVNGAGTTNSTAVQISQSTLTHVSALAPADAASGTRGVFSSGSNTVSDTTISGSQGFNLSDPGTVDTLSRVTVTSESFAVLTDGGTIDIDDAVIDLGTEVGTVGLAAVNFNNGVAHKTINANHVTIVGGGANSKGAWAYAAAPGALTTSIVNLSNSIVRGPETSLVADATNDGAQGGPSTATVNVSFTDFKNKGGTIAPVTGAGGIVEGAGNLIDVDPGFVSPTDRHLTVGSAVVDQGDPVLGGPATDLDGLPRVADGDALPGARRDMGAYEVQDNLAPDTTITSGPAGLTNDATPTFGFSSETGATFECKVDAAAYAACTSPLTTGVLAEGAHTFSVRARDAATNLDTSPATRGFTVDTVAPDTKLTKAPPKRTSHARIKVKFPWLDSGTPRFECRLDKGTFRACTSPYKVKVKVGKHTIEVRAIDAAGNVDPTPAKVKFRRIRRT